MSSKRVVMIHARQSGKTELQRTASCFTCAWHKQVWTFAQGLNHFCLHPRSAHPADALPVTIYSAREKDSPCGIEGHMHSSGLATFTARHDA